MSAEYNFYWDAESAKIVIGSSISLTMISLDLTQKTSFTEEIMNKLKSIETKFGDLVLHFFSHLNNQQKKCSDLEYSKICDAVVSVYLIKPEIFKSQFMNVEVEIKFDLCYGRTICDIDGINGKNKNVLVLLDLDNNQF